MQSLKDFIGKSVALVDRGFIVADGRVVYPSAHGVLVAYDDTSLCVQLAGDSNVTVFFTDALRCVREAPLPTMQPAPAPAPAEG